MKKQLLLFSFVVLVSLRTEAQLPPDVWHDGYALINEKDSVFGKIKYNFQSNLIQLQQGDVVKTFASQTITMFAINDLISKRVREFYVVPYSLKGSYKSPLIFELLQQGKHMTLFAREVMVTESMPVYGNHYMAGSRNMRRERLDYEFYFMTAQGKIIRYNRKKRELYNVIFKDKSSEVKRYVKKNKVKIERAAGLIKATVFYNELKEGKIKPSDL